MRGEGMQGETPIGVEAVEWHWLRPHYQRDALWLVAPDLELEAVSAAMARDEALLVKEWLHEGRLAKPTEEQVAVWEADPTVRLQMLIVQPFVLVQTIAG